MSPHGGGKNNDAHALFLELRFHELDLLSSQNCNEWKTLFTGSDLISVFVNLARLGKGINIVAG